jgi:CRISPR-associated protein Csh2
LVFWVQLKSDSKKVLPTFNNLITMKKENNQSVFDFSGIKSLLNEIKDDIEKIEIYYLKDSLKVENLPVNTKQFDIISGGEIK